MNILANSQDVTITGGHFSNVKGNQHNNYHVDKSIRSVYVERQIVKQGKRTARDDYLEIPTGDVYLVKQVAEASQVESEENPRVRDPEIDATRTMNVARLSTSNTEYLHVKYDGRGAMKAFKRDLKKYSSIKNINALQLFGYNSSKEAPSLLFYDAPVSVAKVLSHNTNSPALYAYFSYQLSRSGIFVTGGRQPGARDLWIDTQSGHLRLGPGVNDGQQSYFLSDLEVESTETDTSLAIQSFKDDKTVCEYLSKMLPSRDFLQALARGMTGYPYIATDDRVELLLLSPPGSIYSRSRGKVVATRPILKDYVLHGVWPTVPDLPDSIRNSRVLMQDGTIRFTVPPWDVHNVHCLDIVYGMPWSEWDKLGDLWLAQAHSIFVHHNVEDHEWDDYSIFRNFALALERESEDLPLMSRVYIRRDRPFYLFILPIPRFSDDPITKRCWMKGNKYYWSLDPHGRAEVPEDARMYLPAFKSTIKIDMAHFEWRTYEAVHKFQVLKGFDPRTTAFARSLELLILDVSEVDSDGRFEEIRECSEEEKFDEIEDISNQRFLPGVPWAGRQYAHSTTEQEAYAKLSSIGTVRSETRGKDIAFWSKAPQHLGYRLSGLNGPPADSLRETMLYMENGSIRFCVTFSTLYHVNYLELGYSLQSRRSSRMVQFRRTWLLQAHSVLDKLQVGEHWEAYLTIAGFWLHLHRRFEDERPTIGSFVDTPYYLFVRPIPLPSDDPAVWSSWERSKYYWSLDAYGTQEMTESHRISLGLPSFTIRMSVYHESWDKRTYDAIHDVQAQQGFDPKTADFARTIGLPILEVESLEPQTDRATKATEHSSSTIDHSIVTPIEGKTEGVEHKYSKESRSNEDSTDITRVARAPSFRLLYLLHSVLFFVLLLVIFNTLGVTYSLDRSYIIWKPCNLLPCRI
ncbi:hypothetical protein Moror_4511 [Moniliophthora roreri MCA 2997]|uniref:Uncharacterized protein n=1 Tax=Moniliophthora roreri (strain MCA 2997) TaxID=1381753 RepID=V2YL98_MONRO|nr:hypothetical protein Moror_4511 [Moniliophthora roreri MCA 2997]